MKQSKRGNLSLGKVILMGVSKKGRKTLSLHAFNSSLCVFIWEISKNVKPGSPCRFLYQIVKCLGNLCEELYADFYN